MGDAGEPAARRVAVAVGADRCGARPVRPVSVGVETSIELRQLRYFIAVAEELHFGRAARRLHMSQSPLSRAIRELEHDLGLVLFVRTTRRVELTPAGAVLLDRSRRALAELDGAIIEARRTADSQHGVLGVGYGPFSRPLVERFAAELAGAGSGLRLRLAEEVSPESLHRVAVPRPGGGGGDGDARGGPSSRRTDRRTARRAAARRGLRGARVRGCRGNAGGRVRRRTCACCRPNHPGRCSTPGSASQIRPRGTSCARR